MLLNVQLFISLQLRCARHCAWIISVVACFCCCRACVLLTAVVSRNLVEMGYFMMSFVKEFYLALLGMWVEIGAATSLCFSEAGFA